MSEPIRAFTGEFRFLSNFHLEPVMMEGLGYPSVEHAYQAAKTFDVDQREHIRHLPTPGQAKAAGRRVTLRPDWELVKVDVMRSLIEAKFTRINELGRKLVATGDRELVEGNWWHDNFWGVDFRTPQKGQNVLGKLLMQRREEIR